MADQPQVMEFKDFLTQLKGPSGGHDADFLLVTCIDFRAFPEVFEFLKAGGYSNKYDHIIVAGAELGPVVDFMPHLRLHWQQFFVEHLTLSKDLHKFKTVVVLGHRNCGAYEKFGLLKPDCTRKEEEDAHAKQALRFKALVEKYIPGMPVVVGLVEVVKADTPDDDKSKREGEGKSEGKSTLKVLILPS